MAAGKKTGGRKKGSANKVKSKLAVKIEAMEAATAAGETPLDYMLRIMRDPRTEHERRDRMAANVAPYVHAKLASMTVAGDPNKPINVINKVVREIVHIDDKDRGGIRAAAGAEPI